MSKQNRILIAFFLILAVLCGVGTTLYKEALQGKSNLRVTGVPLKFGATYMTMNNPYFPVLNDSIREVVAGNGDILITRDPAQNQDKQNAQILDMLDEGISALFLQPVDWKTVEPALQACKEAGVPVFNVDSYVYHSDLIVSSILSDNYDAGVQIAQDVLKKSTHAKIVILNHNEINSTNLRVQGFLDTLSGHEEYEVVIHKLNTAELEVAMDCMLGIIDSGVDFDIIFGGNDPTALGVLAAIQLRHVEKPVYIYGIDGSPEAKVMIEKGFLEGSSAQRPIQMGHVAAQMAYQYLSGETVENDILIPVTLITRANLDHFDINAWQ